MLAQPWQDWQAWRNRYKFISTNRNRPCKICGKTDGSCSVAHHYQTGAIRYFCISYKNGESEGYQFLYTSRDGLWGIYCEPTEDTQKFQKYKGFSPRPASQSIKSTVNYQERKKRDAHFKWLLSKMPLQAGDKSILKQKGLLEDEINSEIFGTTSHGILIAFPDVFGYKVAAQIRSREEGNGSRYCWYKNKIISSSSLPNGQTPIAVWQNSQSDKSKLAICEGYLKSYIAWCQYSRIGQNHPWLGFGSVSYLQSGFEEIQRSIKKINPQEITFYPDSNSGNKKQISEKYLEFWNQLTQLFPQIKLTIASWGHEFKKGEDIDEIIDKSNIKFIAYSEYLSYFKGVEIYEIEKRLEFWKQKTEVHKFILDSSPTGTGKTHDCGQWNYTPAIYINTDHRNPSTDTLNSWSDVEARHGGLYRDPKGYLRRVVDGETEPDIPSNCYQHEVHLKLREKGYPSIQICKNCEFFNECQNGEGNGYGYLYQRQKSLISDKIRIHPDSLPDPNKYDYKNKTIFIEEAGDITLVSELKGNTYHLEEYQKKIEKLNLDQIEKERLQNYLEQLKTAVIAQRGKKYGTINHIPVPEISNATQLTLLNEINEGILEISEPDEIAETEWGKSKGYEKYLLARINKQLKGITAQPKEILQQIDRKINPILSWLLCGYNAWISNDGTFTVYRPKTEIQEIIKCAKNVIFLDATSSRDVIALKYGIQPHEIHQIEAKKSTEPNLEIIQIDDLGKLCQERGKDQLKRLDELLKALKDNEPNTRVIDLKKYSSDGCWWRDSRGRNEFQDCKQLILVGTPSRNLGQSLCTFLALGGKPHEFQEYYNNQIKADIIQGIGRIRAQQRPTTPLKVILITNYNTNISNIKKIKSTDITEKAAPKQERTVQKIVEVYNELQNQNLKPTQKIIAEQLKIARETVNRLWKQVLSILEKAKDHCNIPQRTETVDENLIEEYADAMAEIIFDFEPGLDAQDTQTLIINTFLQVYQIHKSNLIKNILLKAQEKYGNALLKRIYNILNSS